jgi:hypothetical protein
MLCSYFFSCLSFVDLVLDIVERIFVQRDRFSAKYVPLSIFSAMIIMFNTVHYSFIYFVINFSL